MLDPIINSYELTTCQLLYLTNTYKPKGILLTISRKEPKMVNFWVCAEEALKLGGYTTQKMKKLGQIASKPPENKI